jgi:hypothetical protein
MIERRLALVLAGGALMLGPSSAGGSALAPARALPVDAAPRLASWPSGTRGRIVRTAARQLGYRDSGRYCTKFGPCEPWCALFSTWAWRAARIPIARYPFTGSIYYWAALNTRVLRPGAAPKPGDAVLFGTGPRSIRSSLHVAIVEDVYPGYLLTIEGNTDHRVVRLVVPTANPARVGEPGRIYAYASPLRAAPGRPRAARRPDPAAAARALRASVGQQAGREPPAHASKVSATDLRLRRTIRKLRALQHMPYQADGVKIGWTRVNPHGQIEVAVISRGTLAAAKLAWASFLAHWRDAGNAYAVTYYTAG